MPFQDSFAFWKSNIIYEGESLYNYLQVTETEDSVILSTNVAFGVQSIYKKDGSLSGYYYEYALIPFFMDEASFDKDLNVLVLGLEPAPIQSSQEVFSQLILRFGGDRREDRLAGGKVFQLERMKPPSISTTDAASLMPGTPECMT